MSNDSNDAAQNSSGPRTESKATPELGAYHVCAEGDCYVCAAKRRASDPTQFTTRSFAMVWNEGHNIRLINRDDPNRAISIPWGEIPALQALIDPNGSDLRKAVTDLFCCECGKKFSQADEWSDCKTHPRIQSLLVANGQVTNTSVSDGTTTTQG